MRKYLPILFAGFCFPVSAQQFLSTGCNPATSQADLDIANVRTKILASGDLWNDRLGASFYEVPKNSGKYSLYAGAIWIGGTDDQGNLRLAAQTYRQSGNDFWSGPIDTATGDVTPAICTQYDRHWQIYKGEVEQFAAGGSASQVIIDYPGEYAPYVDVNADGVYNYQDGDYPMFDSPDNHSQCNCTALHGDQCVWWVMNDVGNNHLSSNSSYPLGMEFRCQAFAFSSGDDDLSNATFYEYKIISHLTTTTINNTWFGFWVDADLGNYLDDYVGCDVQRGLGYTYNGDMTDEGISGYGTNPPAIGLDIIHGPAADVGDGVDNDRDSCIDCTFLRNSNGVIIDTIPDTVSPELIKMNRFVYYNNNNHPVSGNPELANEYYTYLQGIWLNGMPMRYGGNGNGGGIGATTDTCYFMYPGNSDPYHWGTNGIPENDWTELTAGSVPDDRRFLSSAGPFTMQPGQVQCVQAAVLWARDSAGPISSVEKLKLVDDKIGGGSLDCANFPIGVFSPDFTKTTVYPVPANDFVNFTFNKYITSGTIKIYDVRGTLVNTLKFSGDRTRISSKELVSGIYFYHVMAEDKSMSSGKFVRK